MKALIVNADDYGYSDSVNRGILRAHSNGIVTSTSLMINGVGVVESIDNLKNFSDLSKGLHFTLNERVLDEKIRRKEQITSLEIGIVAKQLKEQLDQFKFLFGEFPDHLDSHHSIHSHDQLINLFKEISKQISIPLRGFSEAKLISNFYKKVDKDSLIKILECLPSGANELMCHPGIVDDHLVRNSSYVFEREDELKALTSDEVVSFIRDSDIELCTWSDFKHRI